MRMKTLKQSLNKNKIWLTPEIQKRVETATREWILSMLPANICTGCGSKKICVCAPNFQCNGLKIIEKIIAATRREFDESIVINQKGETKQ
jgi:hypothetical protein